MKSFDLVNVAAVVADDVTDLTDIKLVLKYRIQRKIAIVESSNALVDSIEARLRHRFSVHHRPAI